MKVEKKKGNQWNRWQNWQVSQGFKHLKWSICGAGSSETEETEWAPRALPGPPSLATGLSAPRSVRWRGEGFAGTPPLRRPGAARLPYSGAGEPGPEGKGFSLTLGSGMRLYAVPRCLYLPVVIYWASARELAGPFSAQSVGATVFWRV